jgi:cation diffusion facilitator family transporter
MEGQTQTVPAGTGTSPVAEKEQERALFWNLVVGTVPAIPKLVAALLSGSVTLFTSGIKTLNEAAAIFIAWTISKKIANGDSGTYDYGMGKFENLARIITGGLILVSLVILILAAVYRLLFPAPVGSFWAMVGMAIVMVMAVVDCYFWIRNSRFAENNPSPIMDAQCRLFRLKALANFLVLATLVLDVCCAAYPWAVYIDPLASFFGMGILLVSGYRLIVTSLPDLLDRTLDEEFQILVVKELADHFACYEQLHGVKSRRSGEHVYIDIFLEFRGDLKMSKVQEIIDDLKCSLEKRIPKSTVHIIPSRGRENGRI